MGRGGGLLDSICIITLLLQGEWRFALSKSGDLYILVSKTNVQKNYKQEQELKNWGGEREVETLPNTKENTMKHKICMGDKYIYRISRQKKGTEKRKDLYILQIKW